jgi:hypothetical protein
LKVSTFKVRDKNKNSIPFWRKFLSNLCYLGRCVNGTFIWLGFIIANYSRITIDNNIELVLELI